MSLNLNKFMHPRNRYKIAKPNFLVLALKYPDFRAHITQDDSSGKVFLDFKNADALRALTTCLLKEDFNLSVVLPADRLVPTLPLRLNYIHWLEDIIGSEEGKWGIDIGTGASCIYPLLAATMNKWQFLATEADAENAFHASKNVETNSLQHLIHVKKVSTEDVLTGSITSFTDTDKFDFCMCNPPFFVDHMEAQAITNTRSLDRPEAGSVSTASPQESIAHGGEVGFIRQMIEESAVVRDKIRVYTSMVGRKTSLAQLKEELRHQKVPNFSTTEFCQGKTMRWAIAWSFDSSVKFPRSRFESRKEKPPLQYMIPHDAGVSLYKVHQIADYLRELLESIKVHCYQGKKAKSYTSITLTAVENTWCHQRRLRRQQQRKQQEEKKGDQKDEPQLSEHENSPTKKAGTALPPKRKETEFCHLPTSKNQGQDNQPDAVNQDNNISRKRPADDLTNDLMAKKLKEKTGGVTETEPTSDTGIAAAQRIESHSGTSFDSLKDGAVPKANPPNAENGEASNRESSIHTSPKGYILKCVMRLKLVDEQVQLELEWLDGQSRELLHQLMTYLKNKLQEAKK